MNLIRRTLTNLDRWSSVGLLAASLGLNVFLALGYHRLPRSDSTDLRVGQKLSALTLSAFGGESITFDWASDSRPTFVYVFSPSCVWCGRNLQNINTIVEAKNPTYRFVGLSLTATGLEEYVKNTGFRFPVYTNPVDATGRAVKLHATPQSFIISSNGRVQEAWLGAYSGKLQATVERKLGVRLPGLPSSVFTSGVTHSVEVP